VNNGDRTVQLSQRDRRNRARAYGFNLKAAASHLRHRQAVDQLTAGDLERCSQPNDVVQAEVAFAPLDRADVGHTTCGWATSVTVVCLSTQNQPSNQLAVIDDIHHPDHMPLLTPATDRRSCCLAISPTGDVYFNTGLTNGGAVTSYKIPLAGGTPTVVPSWPSQYQYLAWR
jgi:hypothetical protein